MTFKVQLSIQFSRVEIIIVLNQRIDGFGSLKQLENLSLLSDSLDLLSFQKTGIKEKVK